jgi:hypothetical protein
LPAAAGWIGDHALLLSLDSKGLPNNFFHVSSLKGKTKNMCGLQNETQFDLNSTLQSIMLTS